jgi:hypothetical protein
MHKRSKTTMKKQIYIFLFIFLSLIAFGQSNLIVIKGKIFEGKYVLNKIPGMNTWLIINDSLIIESQPDSSGQFEYKISRKFLQSYKVKITAFQDQNILDKQFPVYDCPYLRMQPTFFRNDIDLKAPASDVEQITINLKPKHVFIDMRSLSISFKKNSIEFCNCDLFDTDTTMFCIRKILREESKLYIELNIHSWDESNEKQLSINRGQNVMKRLHEHGVDTTRVKIKTWGSLKPLLKPEYIAKAKSIAEKEKLECRNRRAVVRVLWAE